jgi:hypothetical protein
MTPQAIAQVPVVGSRRPVARFALSPAQTHRPAISQRFLDRLPPVGEFGGPHHLPGGVVDHRQARRLAAGVHLDLQWLTGSLCWCFVSVSMPALAQL